MFPLMLCSFHPQTLNDTVSESVLGNPSDGTMERMRVQRGRRKNVSSCPSWVPVLMGCLRPVETEFGWAREVRTSW